MSVRHLVISILLVTFATGTAFGARQAVTVKRANPRAAKSAQTALPLNDEQPGSSWTDSGRQSLGRATSTSVAPGIVVGYTWYDNQHNGSMGRMVDWGVDPSDGFQIHMSWMFLATDVLENRKFAYNRYDAQTDALIGAEEVQPDGEYSGYVGLDVGAEGRACIGGHNDRGDGFQNRFYWWSPGFDHWSENCGIPDSVVGAGMGIDWQQDPLKAAIWPKFRYQDIPGQEHVLHVFCQVSEEGAGDPQAIIYFRKVGLYADGVWDYPPYVVDTVHDIAQDVACSNTDGKVALVWFANLPASGDCDTCSSHNVWPFSQWDNDVYYQISYDYGATFEPRVNLTMNVDGEDGYRPYTDASVLIDSDNDLHIAWGARVWPSDANTGGAAGQLRCRMFHWGENLGLPLAANIRTVANLEWDQVYCNGGSWQLNGSKMSISECDGKLYYIWTQFNDIPNGVEDDCHERALGGTSSKGSANGDLYLAVSSNGGMTWDQPRNLTNTRTPHCDSANGSGGRCQSEVWPSMARHGTNQAVGSNVVIVEPGGSWGSGWFLDVQYIDDADPGAIIQDEGSWTQSDVRWFRMPCVEPVPFGDPWPTWTKIAFPEYTQHGTMYAKALTIENPGNVEMNYTLELNEDPGPYSGWLTVSPSLEIGSIPPGSNNTISGHVYINENLAINEPGTIVNLTGNMTLTSTLGVYVFPINFLIVDTIVAPSFDTISTGCFSLVVTNTGNYGRQGQGKVNLDYFDYGDCDNAAPGSDGDTIPGWSDVYLYDASPVICWTDEFDTVRCNWSIFGQGYMHDNGFFPMGNTSGGQYYKFDTCVGANDSTYICDTYSSQFVTRDTGILIEKTWYIPHVPDHQENDGANFLVQVLRFSSADGQTHTGLNIGEAIDWDIPSDSSNRNRSGFDAANYLIYQQGSEYNDDPEECQENSDRYGGIALLATKEIDGETVTEFTGDPYGAWTGSNALWVYPTGGFVPSELDSLMTHREGYYLSDSFNVDLSSVMTFRSNYTLTPTKSIQIYTCLITSRIGYASFIAAAADCHTWYADNLQSQGYALCGACCTGDSTCTIMSEEDCGAVGGTFKGVDTECDPDNPCASCCIGYRGDINQDGVIDISDLVALVDCMFWGGDWCWECPEQSDVNGSGALDISDLVYMVDLMFTGGPWPPLCP